MQAVQSLEITDLWQIFCFSDISGEGMLSKVDNPIPEYFCRWNIPGWNNLRQCFVDAVFSDHFICSWDSAGVGKLFHVWFPDGSVKKQPDKTTLRWIKLLKRAIRLGSKVALLGDLVTCGSENDVGGVQLRLTARNALMMSGQCSMSGGPNSNFGTLLWRIQRMD